MRFVHLQGIHIVELHYERGADCIGPSAVWVNSLQWSDCVSRTLRQQQIRLHIQRCTVGEGFPTLPSLPTVFAGRRERVRIRFYFLHLLNSRLFHFCKISVSAEVSWEERFLLSECPKNKLKYMLKLLAAFENQDHPMPRMRNTALCNEN